MSRLKAARLGKFTQREAARRLGISWRTLLRWEKPEFRVESLPAYRLRDISALYGVPFECLELKPAASKTGS